MANNNNKITAPDHKPFNIISFNSVYEQPINRINKGKGYVEWGKDNLYSNYLVDLYNYKGSAAHKATIDRKVDLISGRGFDTIKSESLKHLVKRTKLERQVKRAVLDYELLNGFAFEVIWANDKETIASIKHINYHKLREGIESDDVPITHHLYSKDWKNYRREEYIPEIIADWNIYNKEGKQIYVYTEYNLDSNIYPIPSYSTVFNQIETEYKISVFHLNQVNQGYSPSFILNFASGIPSDEEMDEFAELFEKEYAGAENAGKIVITYSKGVDQQPHLEAVKLNDTDKRFVMLKEQLTADIVMAAKIPPQLLTVVPGKLDGTGDRTELLTEFQLSYITPRQEIIEEVLNEILTEGGYDEEIKLKQYLDTDENTDEIKEIDTDTDTDTNNEQEMI